MQESLLDLFTQKLRGFFSRLTTGIVPGYLRRDPAGGFPSTSFERPVGSPATWGICPGHDLHKDYAVYYPSVPGMAASDRSPMNALLTYLYHVFPNLCNLVSFSFFSHPREVLRPPTMSSFAMVLGLVLRCSDSLL